MLKLVEADARYLLDFIFGVYYMWWLWKFYHLTASQIYESLVIWIKGKLSKKVNPITNTLMKGDAQLYAEVE